MIFLILHIKEWNKIHDIHGLIIAPVSFYTYIKMWDNIQLNLYTVLLFGIYSVWIIQQIL